MNRIVITGIGVISPIGVGREAFWKGATAGQSGLGPITLFDASTFPVRIGGEVKGFDAAAVLASFPEAAATRDRKVLLRPGGGRGGDCRRSVVCQDICGTRFCALAWDWKRSAWRTSRPLPVRLTWIGKWPVRRWPRQMVTGCKLRWILAATILGNRYGLLAGRYTNCSACAAGTQVVGEAWQMLRRGQAAVALAGAADSMLNPLGLGGFSLLRVLSTENDCPQQACRPFDATREGTVLGEGAAIPGPGSAGARQGPGRRDLCRGRWLWQLVGCLRRLRSRSFRPGRSGKYAAGDAKCRAWS